MSHPTAARHAEPRRLGRSVLAIFAGFVAVFALSLGTDEVLHLLQVYPPWSVPMYDPGLNLLALGYRLIYGVLGGYLMAKLAPGSPMGHALVGGMIGLVLSTVGAIAMIPKALGPAWYPIALALTAVPTAWLGGRWYLRRRNQPAPRPGIS